jgi:hypothetical protein
MSNVQQSSLSTVLIFTHYFTIGILVRHDAAKNALRRHLGEAAVILYVSSGCKSLRVRKVTFSPSRTIYDSKGSEFDDVCR